MLFYFIGSVILSILMTALLSKKFIPYLRRRKLGQPILEIGPRWHKSKEGTPTMGGLFFIFPILFLSAILSLTVFPRESLPKLWITLGMALLYGAIGFVDDRAKLLKKQNEGLRASQKFFLQIAVAALYLSLMTWIGAVGTSVTLPFFRRELELGYAYYGFALIMIVGMNNSVNLTDGIDGLCASVSAVVSAFFAVCAFRLPAALAHTSADGMSLALLSGAVCGGSLGFLVYNWHPARIFMGDTGSLFLGGILTGLAFLLDLPLIILAVGLFFVFETVSVILQVAVFKLTGGKRLFKMAPFHHHLEKCGWKETSITAFAILVTVALAVLSYLFL